MVAREPRAMGRFGSTAADTAGRLSQSDTLCGTAHSTLSATTASAYHKQRQHDMRHNGIGISQTTASAYGICRNCDMRHNGSVMLDMPHLAYAFSSIGRYAPMRIGAYTAAQYHHMPICPYRHRTLPAYVPRGLMQTSRNSNKHGNHNQSY